MKKVLSLVLVVALVLSSMTFAFAAPAFEDIADIDYEEAIDTLFALGVVDGYEDGTYKPERIVSRAEMAKLMVELLGYGDLVSGGKSNFGDTQGHWADSWIALAAGRGIVIGDPSGNFRPDATVSYDEVYTMLVRGLGYTDSSNELKNMTWPTNFKVKAAELNITKNVDMKSGGADRGGVAQAMFNALDQQIVKVNSDGDVVKEFTTKGSRIDIPVNLISRIAIPDYDFEVGFEHINPDDKNYAGDNVDLSGYLFQTVEAYFSKNNDKEIVYIGDVESLTYKDEYESLKGNDLEVGDYTFDIVESLVSYNNDEVSLSEFKTADLEDAKITVVLKSNQSRVRNDALVAGLIVEKASAYVQIEDEYKADAKMIDEIYLPIKSSKVDSANLIVKGDATELSEIEEDDIVAAYAPLDEDPTVEAPDKLTLVVTRNVVEGKITGISGSDYFVDRVKYKLNDGLNIGSLDIDDEGTFFLDDNGKIIAFEGESDGSKTYAVVDELISGRYEVNNGKATVIRAPRVKLHTSSNEKITYSFDLDIEWEVNKWIIDNEDLEAHFELGSADNKTAAGDRVISIVDVEGLSDTLVSYSLNKDGEISKLALAGRTITDVRTSSASFELASNAVIFDVDGKVISEDDLGTTVTGKAVYQNGKIIALLATNVVEEVTQYYAYITKIGRDTDSSGDEIQRFTAYMNGKKDENLYTDDKGIVPTAGKNEVYVLKVNDKGVVTDKVGNTATVTTSGAIASNVDLRDGEFKIGAKTYYLDQGATIIEKVGTDIYVRNLNALNKTGVTITVYAEGAQSNLVKFIIIE